MIAYHRIGYFQDGSKRRYILMQVEEHREGYYFRLRFRIQHDEEYFFNGFHLFNFTCHRWSDDTTYLYMSGLFSFTHSWQYLQRTAGFKMIKEDLKALNAVIDMHKFKQLYEKYRIEDKLLNQL